MIDTGTLYTDDDGRPAFVINNRTNVMTQLLQCEGCGVYSDDVYYVEELGEGRCGDCHNHGGDAE